MLLLSYRNTCGNLGEQEMLVETQAHGQVFPQVFQIFSNFPECSYNSMETWTTCFLSFLENSPKRDYDNFSVLVWSYRNTLLNQSVCTFFFLSYFLKPIKWVTLKKQHLVVFLRCRFDTVILIQFDHHALHVTWNLADIFSSVYSKILFCHHKWCWKVLYVVWLSLLPLFPLGPKN